MPDGNGSYNDIRGILHPALRNLSDQELADYLTANGIDAEAVNDFMGAISSAMPTIQRVAGGALSGAQTGMAFGPYGALIGGIGGGLLSGFAGPQQPAPPPPPPAAPAPPPAWTPPPGGIAPMPQQPAPPQPFAPMPPQPFPAQPAAPMTAALPAAGIPGGSPAAAQLLSLLSQPQVLQAVLSMALGTLGTPSVGVGGAAVPVSAFPRALAALANNAAAEFAGDAYDESWLGLGVDRNDHEAVAEAVIDRFAGPAPVADDGTTNGWAPVATYGMRT